VASLYSVWTSSDGEDLVTMSFLLRPASEYVMEHGHHRQPFFIEEAGFDAWMEPGKREAKDSLAILRECAREPPLEYRRLVSQKGTSSLRRSRRQGRWGSRQRSPPS
jgi:putative SOS response-associated peptidase YedK